MSHLIPKEKQRLAVSIFFAINGFLYTNWASRLPELQLFFQVDDAKLGQYLLVLAIGAIISMPFAGFLTTHIGSRRITQITGVSLGILIPFIPFFQSTWLLLLVFLLLGFTSGAQDVAMNGQAVYVEKQYEKSIMSSFHAIFSIGMSLGAVSGAIFTAYNIGLQPHLTMMGIMGASVALWATQFLNDDDMMIKNDSDTGGSGFQLPTLAILPLGFIALGCMTGESAMTDWSAKYMENIGASKSLAALSVGSFSVAMTIGRIFGDYFTEKLGKKQILLLDGALAFVGLAMMLIFQNEMMTLIGLFLVGLGLATIVPIVYSTAGNTEGVSPSVGIAMATTIGYTGFFIGPPVIGFLSKTYNSLAIALTFVLFLFFAMFMLTIFTKIKK